MTDSIQFSVTRLSTNLYRVIVQNRNEILRTADVPVSEIMDKLGYELEQLQSQ